MRASMAYSPWIVGHLVAGLRLGHGFFFFGSCCCAVRTLGRVCSSVKLNLYAIEKEYYFETFCCRRLQRDSGAIRSGRYRLYDFVLRLAAVECRSASGRVKPGELSPSAHL